MPETIILDSVLAGLLPSPGSSRPLSLAQMRTRVRTILHDPTAQLASDAAINDWLNDAYLDLAARLRLIRTTTTGTTTGNTIPFPTGTLEVLSLRIGTTDVQFVADDTWNDYSDSGDTPSTTIARVFGQNIEVYPTPTTSSAYTMRTAQEPAALTADGDQPLLPAQLHTKLVAYAAAQGRLLDEEVDWQAYMSLYERNLPEPPMGLAKIDPTPWSFTFEPGPFDTPDSRHF